MTTAKQMQSNSVRVQIKKYGGEEGYRVEMKRRNELAQLKRYGKVGRKKENGYK